LAIARAGFSPVGRIGVRILTIGVCVAALLVARSIAVLVVVSAGIAIGLLVVAVVVVAARVSLLLLVLV